LHKILEVTLTETSAKITLPQRLAPPYINLRPQISQKLGLNTAPPPKKKVNATHLDRFPNFACRSPLKLPKAREKLN